MKKQQLDKDLDGRICRVTLKAGPVIVGQITLEGYRLSINGTWYSIDALKSVELEPEP